MHKFSFANSLSFPVLWTILCRFLSRLFIDFFSFFAVLPIDRKDVQRPEYDCTTAAV